MKTLFLVGLVILASLTACESIGGPGSAGSPGSQERPAFYLEKDGFVYIIAEAEDFQGTGKVEEGEWEAGDYNDGRSYFADAIGGAYMSRERYLGASEKSSGAYVTQDINVPRAGTYHIWGRYESPYMYNTRFGVQVIQNGERVFDKMYGAIENNKLWPLGVGNQPQMDWGYGGGDNVCWEGVGYTAELEAGAAQLRLEALENPEPAARRNVDVILVTDDPSEDGHDRTDPWLYQLNAQGRLFLRITNGSDGKPTYLSAWTYYNRRPWGGFPRFTMTKSGLWAEGEVPEEEYLQPGESTPWMDIGQFMDSTHQTSTGMEAHNLGDEPGIHVILEFSSTPSGGGIIRRIDYSHPEKTKFSLTIPSNAPYDTGIYTLEEAWQMMWDRIKEFPEKGKIPERFLFYGMSADLSATEGVELSRLNIAAKLGYNTLSWHAESRAELRMLERRGLKPTRTIILYHYNPTSEEDCRKRAEGMGWRLWNVKIISFGDEIHPSSADPAEVRDEKFREYLREKGLTAEEVMGEAEATWEQISVNTDREISGSKPVLWYESSRFMQRSAIEAFAEKTRWVERYFGPEVLTGANYSPHPFYWPHAWSWAEAFKYRAMTMPWSEDYNWQVPEEGPQMAGYLLDAFRCGAKYHESPIMFYVMPHSPGNRVENFRRCTYEAIAHGAKMIFNFGANPQFFTTENYIDWRDTERYKAIHDVIREVGMVEDFIVEGRVRPAQVAILLSETTDLWELSKSNDTYNITDLHKNPNSNAYNHERKCLWLALRHSGVPVDFLIEDDVVEGYLKDYKVLYIVGDHITRAAAEGIKKWVAEGGALFSVAGGGLWDEYDRPLMTLYPVYGIRDQKLEKRNIHIRTKMELPRLEAIDTISIGGGTMEVLAFKQSFEPVAGVREVGTYADGSPAVLRNEYGEGEAIICGTFPGAAYVKPAIPLWPPDRGPLAHFIPTDFDPGAKGCIGYPFERARVAPPVYLSEPLVEWSVIESPRGLVIPLINYSKSERIDKLGVRIRHPGYFKRIWTVEQGEVDAITVTADGSIAFTIPLGLTDFVVVER